MRSGIDGWLRFAPGRSPCGEAMQALGDCDLAVIIGEGVVIGPDALREEIERFSGRPELRVSLVTGGRILDLGQVSGAELSDPFLLLTQEGTELPNRAPLYFSPCMMTIATGRSRAVWFERFARRSHWASAHLYLDWEPEPTRKFEGVSRHVGLIAQALDRREALDQGHDAFRELTRLGNAHPAYRRLVRRDLIRLIWLQFECMIRGSLPATRWRFLRGLVQVYREERAMKRSIARSVPDLA